MNDELNEPGVDPRDEGFHSLMEIFDELSFKEKWQKVAHGLKQPPDTGEHKWATLQVKRLSAPVSAVLVPILAVVLLMTINVLEPERREIEITIMEPEEIEDLEEIEPIEEIEPPEPTETEIPDETMVTDMEQDVVSPPTEFSPQPAELDSVALTKSPVILRGILGSRNPGARGSLLGRYGGGMGTERAVLLALRWLKKNQESDGSWRVNSGGGPAANPGIGTAKPAMTGLAVLTYLAHGETPASEEFGPTVERAIKWLLDNQTANGDFKGPDQFNYCQPIATYALCEAFAMTKVPMIKTAAEKSVLRIVKGQNASGGLWNYNFDPKRMGNGAERNDLSFAGWCIQALKAGGMAGLEVEGLEAAKKKAMAGLRKNFKKSGDNVGYFRYSNLNDQHRSLSGVGTLCTQLLGGAKRDEVQYALKWLERIDCDWEKPGGTIGHNPIYNWYYITQAKFHSGGGTWDKWNKQFSPQLVKNQMVIKDAIADPSGKMVDIGYWKPVSQREHVKGYVYNTTLCALQLQVYYRYLPTFKAPKDLDEEDLTISDEEEDVDIKIL